MNIIDSSLQKSKLLRRRLCFAFCVAAFFILFGLSCTNKKEGQEFYPTQITSTPEITEAITASYIYVSTGSPIPTITATFPPFEPILINVTQAPLTISTTSPGGSDYLYKDAVVTFKLNNWNSTIFLDLDDLTNRQPQNGDFIVNINTGSMGTTFDFFPTNYARFYYSGKSEMDYASCIADFPKTRFEEYTSYENLPIISQMIDTGDPYCMITNEGHLAVMNMLIKSKFTDDEGNLILPFKVTVYSKLEEDLFIPPPTQTPGPSPTPTNRYSNRGLSDHEAKVLDNLIQAFINAISMDDKKSISKMIRYPLEIRLIYSGEIVYLKGQEDFIANYEKIFPNEYLVAFKNATIENNVYSHVGRITLETEGGVIGFSDEGEIISIDVFKYRK